jgi:predicted dehydrogenase
VRTPLSIGVVGLSQRGARLAAIFDRLPRAELGALCDDDPRNRSRQARRYPAVMVTADPLDLFEDEMLDAVVIAGPDGTHYPLAAAAIESGKHVFVVEPLAENGKDADFLVSRAEEAGTRLMVGHKASFAPGVRKLKELANSGRLGEVYYLVGTGLGDDPRGLIAGPLADAVGIVLDVVADQPTEVAARSESYRHPRLPDVVVVSLRFATGITAYVQSSRLDPRETAEVAVVASRGTAVFAEGPGGASVTIYEQLEAPATAAEGVSRLGDVVRPRLEPEDADVVACERFLSSVRSPTVSPDNAREAAAVVHVLGAVTRSIEAEGRPEAVAAVSSGATVIELPI